MDISQQTDNQHSGSLPSSKDPDLSAIHFGTSQLVTVKKDKITGLAMKSPRINMFRNLRNLIKSLARLYVIRRTSSVPSVLLSVLIFSMFNHSDVPHVIPQSQSSRLSQKLPLFYCGLFSIFCFIILLTYSATEVFFIRLLLLI